jgi:hypothetical protein
MKRRAKTTVAAIIAKAQRGDTLTPFENSVYRLNVRPDGTRYSSDKKTRDAQYDEDIKKEQAARRLAAIKAHFARHGFRLEPMGGNCTAYVRSDGQVEELIVLASDSVAPTRFDDICIVSTYEIDAEETRDETRTTVGRILAALRDRRDEYHLLNLRLANGYGTVYEYLAYPSDAAQQRADHDEATARNEWRTP